MAGFYGSAIITEAVTRHRFPVGMLACSWPASGTGPGTPRPASGGPGGEEEEKEEGEEEEERCCRVEPRVGARQDPRVGAAGAPGAPFSQVWQRTFKHFLQHREEKLKIGELS